MRRLIDRLERQRTLEPAQWAALIRGRTPALDQYVFQRAMALRRQYYGDAVYIRGLIEFTNCCKNDCYYCGIRRSNSRVRRYRLTEEEILSCCGAGWDLDCRTFVLQGGEDPAWSPDRLARLVAAIKARWPGCAVTLSVGEHPSAVYRRWFDAGADRYLLRHETADPDHYRLLHPPALSLARRMDCLWALKDIGYQVGCGFMVGSPGQTAECLAEDFQFIRQLEPDMVGIGPFLPQRDTPFGDRPAGGLALTCFLLGLLRIMLPNVLLPATTALATLHPEGRALGLRAGANVCMPNLSPPQVRGDYALYDNKRHTGAEAAEHLDALKAEIAALGLQAVADRGDPRPLRLDLQQTHPTH